MARRNEYTGETCACGRRTYYKVVQIAGRPETRRGPSCWYDDCAAHRAQQPTGKDYRFGGRGQ